MQSHDKLKIGYSKNCNSRLKTFQTGNPDIILLTSKPGLKSDETKLHNLCKDYHIVNEGYQDVPEVHKIFNEYDSGHNKEFEKLKHFVDYYSKEGIGKIMLPHKILQVTTELNEYKNITTNTDDIPEDVIKYIKYVENILTINTIAFGFYYPEGDITENVGWKRSYQINDAQKCVVPYEDLLNILYKNVLKQLELCEDIHSEHIEFANIFTTKLNQPALNIFTDFAKNFVNLDMKITKESKALVNRLSTAIKVVEKILSED